jgi:NAD(P)-dependent dehydrogenase (short-subunit alcohol dehydrogenase family)
MDRLGIQRRGFLMAAAATGAVAAGGARAQSEPGTVQTDNSPKELAGKPMPEPSPSQSSGPVAPGRGSNLSGKVAVVTGAARGIGRAIAVELAANGADIVAIDIAGFVSPASNAVPASPEELEDTAKMIRAFGRRADTVRADIRDIAALRRIADETDQKFGKIDIVVANAAIQRWKPLLEMEDSDWRDVIDNNLNGTANTIRAFAPKMVAKKKGRILVLSSMQGSTARKTPRAIRPQNGAS